MPLACQQVAHLVHLDFSHELKPNLGHSFNCFVILLLTTITKTPAFYQQKWYKTSDEKADHSSNSDYSKSVRGTYGLWLAFLASEPRKKFRKMFSSLDVRKKRAKWSLPFFAIIRISTPNTQARVRAKDGRVKRSRLNPNHIWLCTMHFHSERCHRCGIR